MLVDVKPSVVPLLHQFLIDMLNVRVRTRAKTLSAINMSIGDSPRSHKWVRLGGDNSETIKCMQSFEPKPGGSKRGSW